MTTITPPSSSSSPGVPPQQQRRTQQQSHGNKENNHITKDRVCFGFKGESSSEDMGTGDICIDNSNFYGYRMEPANNDDPFRCTAAFTSHPGETCRTCLIDYSVCRGLQCYSLDCSNVFPNHTQKLAVCGNRLYPDTHSGLNGGHHGSSSGSSSSSYGFTPMFYQLIAVFAVLGLLVSVFAVVFCKAARGSARQNNGGDAAYNRVDIHNHTRNTNALDVQMTPVSIATVVERLPDTHRTTFAFYNVLDDEDCPLGRKLVQASQRGDWPMIRDALADLRQRMNDKHADAKTVPEASLSSINNERALCAHVLIQEMKKNWPVNRADDTVCCPWLDAWCEAEPDNLDALWVRLDAQTVWAWHARPRRRTREVSRTRFDVFFQRLRSVRPIRERALQLFPPHDPIIYTAAITLALGLQEPMELVQGYLKKLEATADPHHSPAHCRALQFQCQNWYGSHDLMFRYVRRITKDLPQGHPSWVLVPMAIYERTLSMGTGIQRARFRRNNAALRRALLDAYNRALGSTAWEREMDPSLSPADRLFNLLMRNWFMEQVYRFGQMNDMARAQAGVIGKRPLDRCWHTLNNYRSVLRKLGYDVTEGAPEDIPLVEAELV